MNVIGHWLDRVDGVKNEAKFVSIYGITHWQMMVEHEVFDISRIFPTDFKYVAFVEPADNSISQLFILEEGDHLMVYSGCGGKEGMGHFNTDGIAFVSLIKDCKVAAMWSVENSPYDIVVHDEYDQEVIDEATVALKELLKKSFRGSIPGQLIERLEQGEDKILFVGQL